MSHTQFEATLVVDIEAVWERKREAVLAYMRTRPEVFTPYIQPDYLQNFRRIERYVIADAIAFGAE